MSSNSTRAKRPRKPASNRPAKPRKDFPLYAHGSGRWAVKSKGQFYYFGRWGKRIQGKVERLPEDGAEAALAEYKLHYDDVMAGRPISHSTGKDSKTTLQVLCNRFLSDKVTEITERGLSPRMLMDYRAATDRLITQFGKERLADDLGPADFKSLYSTIAKTVGPVRLGNEIGRIRTVFKYALASEWIEKEPNYGPTFRKPSKKEVRTAKVGKGKKLFTSEELLQLLAALKDDPTLRAIVLLGINCGFGNTDIAGLQNKHLQLSKGWIEFARQKSGIPRRCPLWPETVEAIKAAITVRPAAKIPADADCVFITADGSRFVRLTEFKAHHWSRTDYVSRKFGALLKSLKINGRDGLGFYSLRHTFATQGLQAKDREAVKAIMGHAEHDMLSAYDETGPSDERLRAVANCVRDWLFAAPQKGGEQ